MGNKKAVRTEYLIVGNSAGGIGAAEAIREVDRKNGVNIIDGDVRRERVSRGA